MIEHPQALNQFGFLYSQDGGYLRIPIWGHIPLSRPARKIIEHPDFMRLSKFRQLGFVHYVFPGASHTRFEHSIGTYNLCMREMQRLVLNPVNWYTQFVPMITPDEAKITLAASLLHDIGHYPFSHLVDKLPGKYGAAFDLHENRSTAYILNDRSAGSIYSILKNDWDIDDPARVADVITNPDKAGLPGRILSGILDPDKMDYLMRDAWACGVPYGNIDTDRLIESIVLDVEEDRHRLGITEKGIAPLESLVFAKYMMFRHIYWHHTVRIVVAMFTRFIQDGINAGIIDSSLFYNMSDDALIEKLSEYSEAIPAGDLINRVKNRDLYKRGFTLYPEHPAGEEDFAISKSEFEQVKLLQQHPDRRREKETAICSLLARNENISLMGYEVLLDIPRISTVFDIDDFRELHVLISPQTGKTARFVPYNSYGFTQLTADFAQQFERFSRRVQVICKPDIRDMVIKHWRAVKNIVVSED